MLLVTFHDFVTYCPCSDLPVLNAQWLWSSPLSEAVQYVCVSKGLSYPPVLRKWVVTTAPLLLTAQRLDLYSYVENFIIYYAQKQDEQA